MAQVIIEYFTESDVKNSTGPSLLKAIVNDVDESTMDENEAKEYDEDTEAPDVCTFLRNSHPASQPTPRPKH